MEIEIDHIRNRTLLTYYKKIKGNQLKILMIYDLVVYFFYKTNFYKTISY